MSTKYKINYFSFIFKEAKFRVLHSHRIMVTEIKSKCYTCLDPNALVDLASCPSTELDHWSTLVHHELLTVQNRSSTHKQPETTYMKQTRLQIEQYTNHIKTV